MPASVVVRQDYERDEFIVEREDELGCKTRRAYPRYEVGYSDPRRFASAIHSGEYLLRAGTADNDINAIYQSSVFNGSWRNGDGETNAYKPPKAFPRSEQEMDAIMIRRVNARLRLQQEADQRKLRHIGIWTAVIVFAPLVVAAVLRMWGFALAWIAA